jgi:hypothetical protein
LFTYIVINKRQPVFCQPLFLIKFTGIDFFTTKTDD